MKTVKLAPAQSNERIYKWPQRICVECGNKFRSRTHLKCLKCQSPITDRICVECGDKFRSRTNLKCLKCQSPITDKICVECGNKFRSRRGLKCDQCSGSSAKRRAIKKERNCGCIEYLISVKQFLCVYCFKVISTDWEHIIPLARGGLHCWNNLVPACSTCNSRKGTKLLSELGWTLKYEPNLPTCTTKLG